MQKQPTRGVPRKRWSENVQEIDRKTPISKCDFNKVALQHGCSPVNLLHIFGTPFPRNTSGWLLLDIPDDDVRVTLSPTEPTLSHNFITLQHLPLKQSTSNFLSITFKCQSFTLHISHAASSVVP